MKKEILPPILSNAEMNAKFKDGFVMNVDELKNMPIKKNKHKYFIYYNKVYCGGTKGQGNKMIELDHEITMNDICAIETELEKESRKFASMLDIRDSVALVVNFIEFK